MTGSTLEGKVAMVTGAGRGLGRAEALALAEAGAHVIVNGRSAGADVADEIVASGGSAEPNTDDVSAWDGAQRLIDQAISHNGSLDILLCNAGIVRDRMLYNMAASVLWVRPRGEMQFAVTPNRPSSRAAVMVRAMMPALAAL